MLDLSSLLSLLLGGSPVQTLKSTHLSQWLSAPLAASPAAPPQPQAALDPTAVSIVRLHLSDLAALGMPVEQQGVWVQVGNQVVAEHQGTTPLSAASLTKIATTLAALNTWGADRQFTTLIGSTAPVQNGVLQGDLVVQGGGDPFFVWEEAIVLANALQRAGINRVTGNLVVSNNFAMNFETNPTTAANLLEQGMNADLWNAGNADVWKAQAAVQSTQPNIPRPQLVIDGAIQIVSPQVAKSRAAVLLVQHRSLSMSQLLKAMNSYSNNMMAEMLASQLGGAKVVAQKAAQAAQVPPAEIRLINGSGLGNENQISPRAIGAMLVALQRQLQTNQLNVADIFPVVGRDRGTLGRRSLPVGAAVKTGTLDEVSSLAGVFPTRDRGLVWFSIINVGTADLQRLHAEQDLLLQRLVQQWGSASSEAIRPGDRGSLPENQLGAAGRNQVN